MTFTTYKHIFNNFFLEKKKGMFQGAFSCNSVWRQSLSQKQFLWQGLRLVLKRNLCIKTYIFTCSLFSLLLFIFLQPFLSLDLYSTFFFFFYCVFFGWCDLYSGAIYSPENTVHIIYIILLCFNQVFFSLTFNNIQKINISKVSNQ